MDFTVIVGRVYLLKINELYKIGASRDPWRRAEQIQKQVGVSCELIHTIECRRIDHFKAEGMMHQRFSAKRVKGEMFDLSPEDVAKIKAIQSL